MIRRHSCRWPCRAPWRVDRARRQAGQIGQRRYIVCRNHAEARRDADQRTAILEGLRAKLHRRRQGACRQQGFRRYLKTLSAEHFAIDEDRVADDALDGSTSCAPIPSSPRCRPSALVRYRDLWRVEQLFRQASCRARHPADLPQQRHGHPRPRVLPVSSPCCSPRSSMIASAATASPPNGTTFCAISSGCRKLPSNRTASVSYKTDRRRHRQAVSGGRRRPAAQHPRTPTLKPAAHRLTRSTPPLWC